MSVGDAAFDDRQGFDRHLLVKRGPGTVQIGVVAGLEGDPDRRLAGDIGGIGGCSHVWTPLIAVKVNQTVRLCNLGIDAGTRSGDGQVR